MSAIRFAVLCAAFLLLPATASAAPTALGDFDGDGYADLAVGAPADSVQGQEAAGAVNVIYGSSRGLTERGDQQFTTAPQNIPGVPQPGANFGAALATGDLDDDGYADLAIGVPGDDVGGLRDQPRSGRVIVLYGSPGGLRPRGGNTGWSQNSVGIQGNAEAQDEFGSAVAIADFDGDDYGDLAIGAPGDDVDGADNAGAVNVIYGGDAGLDEDDSELWTQNTRGIKGIAGRDHRFGFSLAGGDLSANGRADLAIGIPGGDIGGDDAAGAVSVLYGRSGGLTSVDDLWSQDARGINGIAEPGDNFGHAVAIGDFDADGIGDLAIGAPIDSVGNAAGAGAINVIYGSESGLAEDPDQLFTQNAPGIKSRASIGEQFGKSLSAADLSDNGADDLIIGVPGEEIDGEVNAGAINVLYGVRGFGLSQISDQFWHQNSPGINGVAEEGDIFGEATGVGDFDGDGIFDAAIGVPSDSVAGAPSAGAVNVIYGSGRGLREDPDRLWTQGTRGIKGAVGNDQFGAAVASGLPD